MAAEAREAAETTTSTARSTGSGRSQPEAAGAFVASLFAEHGRMVLGLCRLLLRDPVEAEDAAQQTFLSAHRSIDSAGLPRAPAAWLAAIARNECRARIRLRMREPLTLPDLPDDLPDPLARAIRNADLDALWAGLAALPRRQRRAFLLRELGGLSYGELGAALGVSRPAVESLLFRARRQLRAFLTGTQAVVVPVTMRDRLAEFIPSFEPATAGVLGRAAALPVAAKLATATVGAGLIAAGASEIGSRSRPHARPDAGRQPVVHSVRPAARSDAGAAVVTRRAMASVGRDSAGSADAGDREEADRVEAGGRDSEPQEPAEQEPVSGPETESADEGPATEVGPPAANEGESRDETSDRSEGDGRDSSRDG